MKKIAFILSSMNMGGTEKALLSMLEAIDRENLDITIYLLENKGALLKEVPPNIHIKTISGYEKIKRYVHENIYQNMTKEIIGFHFINAAKLFFSYVVSKLKNDCITYYDFFTNQINLDNIEYDLVGAYQGPMNFITYLVCYKFKAKRKVAWIHFDISKMGYTKEGASKIYNRIDEIFVVSDFAKNIFIKEFPDLTSKTKVLLNALPVNKIRKLAYEFENNEFEKNYINILTIGRISNQKGQDIIPEIVYKLKFRGDKIRWYLIGGIEECDSQNPNELLKEKMNEFDVKNEIIWLGIKDNPYVYLKDCDIYVQPSRYEGFCTTTNEAKLFCLPIITTDVSGSREQFVDGVNGIITKFDVDEIVEEIHGLIVNVDKRNNLSKNLKKESNKINSIDYLKIIGGDDL